MNTALPAIEWREEEKGAVSFSPAPDDAAI
jgi:hypothetical protein